MSVVYFIQAGVSGPVKIGYAANLRQRMTHISSGCPDPLVLLATIPGARPLERRIHCALHASRRRFEWFNPTAEVRALALLAGKRGLEPVERWLTVKEAEVEIRPVDFVPTDDFDNDIRELARIAFRHAVQRHGRDMVAVAIGRSVDVVENIIRRKRYDIPFTCWVRLCQLDPGACLPLEARSGHVSEWMAQAASKDAVESLLARLGPKQASA